MSSLSFWLALTQPRNWSLADVTWQQAGLALLCVLGAIVLGCALETYWRRRDDLTARMRTLDAQQAALREASRLLDEKLRERARKTWEGK